MDLIELLGIAIGLSMDAFAVSICKGLATGRVKASQILCVGLYFGGFQFLMPLTGYLISSLFTSLISSIAAWLAFILLALIGGNMIRESLNAEEEELNASFSPKTMIPLAVATSIDALAVGVSLCLAAEQWRTTLVQTAAVFVFTAISVVTGIVGGKKIGEKAGRWARIIGGAVLIAIGAGLFF